MCDENEGEGEGGYDETPVESDGGNDHTDLPVLYPEESPDTGHQY